MKVNHDYDDEFELAGKIYNVDPRLLKTVFHVESSGNPRTGDSYAGAQGGMQIMPDTARGLNISNARDMSQAIPAAARYLRQGLDAGHGDPVYALRYYNGGPDGPNNPDTLAYVATARQLYGQMELRSHNEGKPAAERPSKIPQVDGSVAAQAPSNAKSTTKPTTKPVDDYPDDDVNAGAAIATGKPVPQKPEAAQPKSTDQDYPDDGVEAGKQLTLQNKGMPDSTTTTAPEKPPLAALGAGLARGLWDVGDGVVNAAQQAATWGNEKFPFLKSIDQATGVYLTPEQTQAQRDARDVAAKDDEQANSGNPLTYGAGRIGGQIAGTTVLTAPIGAVGGIARGGAAAYGPAAQALTNVATRVGVPIAQGAVGSTALGGDASTGAAVGAVVPALGVAARAIEPLYKATSGPVGEYLGRAGAAILGHHFGDYTGIVAGMSLNEALHYVAKKWGPDAADKAMRVLNGATAAGVPGAAGGQAQNALNGLGVTD